MIERAQAGRSVVRLKGGDPFVFGRGGEEAEALAAAGSVRGRSRRHRRVAAPAYAGFPHPPRGRLGGRLRHRARGPAKDDSALDWDALARFPGTLVLYMGVKRLPRSPSAWSRPARPGEPAACVERGRCPASEP